jgi:hypothetical protein
VKPVQLPARQERVSSACRIEPRRGTRVAGLCAHAAQPCLPQYRLCLRLQEALHLEISDIDSDRMMVHPFQLCTHECRITISIGATLFSDHKESVDGLLKQANIAMYQAKKRGAIKLFYDPKKQEIVYGRVSFEPLLFLIILLHLL